ncbi:cytochrome C, class I [Alcaligenes faecalis]|uniref:c-type cytochrome n=1 Tax=Alcaligenes faecalis TaxID=511 RepID=UPI001292D52E|nr:cytochrome c [Alcaligenes faecalis]MBX6965481.1 c-type cytochrome [Providencia rettgeri]MBX7030816.1 c-type cytochrome [Alcaligenes faecalis]QFY77011.1 cytochrome C, class I [Alcaligenes faecalis]
MMMRSLAILLASGFLTVSYADTAVVGGDTQVFTQKTGKELYEQVCASCHMIDAKGATGAGTYPSLSKNPKLGAPAYAVFMVTQGNRAMPGLGGLMNDEQIAEVVNYVRSNFGNEFSDKVTAKDVAAQRPKDHQYVDLN